MKTWERQKAIKMSLREISFQDVNWLRTVTSGGTWLLTVILPKNY
jgi:hypothetical protein